MKVVVDISGWLYDAMMGHREPIYSQSLGDAVRDGIPLNNIKAEIEKLNPVDYGSMFSYESHTGARDMQRDILQILDNISGK